MERDAAVASLVVAARQGSPDAWAELVGRFQDLAVATGLGWSGDLDAARDVAQEAFTLAFRHLSRLEDPEAFPAWFARLVRTACWRQLRRNRLPTIALDRIEPVSAVQSDPATVVALRHERARVRTAIEALPEGERMVVALHYLAELSYPQVAAFLGISLSAAKKRAYTARRRLKELLPMAADILTDSRPSRDDRFRDGILLFEAIRHHDRAAVKRLVQHNPSLIDIEEDWTPAEALELGMPYAAHASPLVRAAGFGDLELVRLLVQAGADAGKVCGCAGAESALWAATVAGAADVVAFLLEAGADPNAPAFAGATPLHVATQRGHHDLVRLLLASGADPRLTDAYGRTPSDWGQTPRAIPMSGATPAHLVATGIRAIDLFAPLQRGALQRWPAAYGLGQLVVVAAMARALSPAEVWWIGFEQDLNDRAGVAHGLRELGVPAQIRLVSRELDPGEARIRFAGTIHELVQPAEAPRLVVCLEARGHTHDVAAALPGLAAHSLATLVIEPFAGEYPVPGEQAPEGYTGQVAFDRRRAERGLWPAIDPRTTISGSYPDQRHQRLATEARDLLAAYDRQDPKLEFPDPATLGDPDQAGAAQRLIRYLTQPLATTEPFTSLPGESTPRDELLDAVEEIVSGRSGPAL